MRFWFNKCAGLGWVQSVVKIALDHILDEFRSHSVVRIRLALPSGEICQNNKYDDFSLVINAEFGDRQLREKFYVLIKFCERFAQLVFLNRGCMGDDLSDAFHWIG